MTTDAMKRATAKYDAANTKRVSLKLNVKTDADILAALGSEANVQGYLKELVRDDLARKRTDAFMLERLDAMLAAGCGSVWYKEPEIGDLGELQVRLKPMRYKGQPVKGMVERWLRERFAADRMDDGALVMDCGNGATTDRIIWPIVDRYA